MGQLLFSQRFPWGVLSIVHKPVLVVAEGCHIVRLWWLDRGDGVTTLYFMSLEGEKK